MFKKTIQVIVGLSSLNLILGASAVLVTSLMVTPKADAYVINVNTVRTSSGVIRNSYNLVCADGTDKGNYSELMTDTLAKSKCKNNGGIVNPHIWGPNAVRTASSKDLGEMFTASVTKLPPVRCPPNTSAQSDGTCLANQNFKIQLEPVIMQSKGRSLPTRP